MQSEENEISSNSVRQLSSITFEEAIRILKPDYMFFNTGNWHLEDESESLQEPCKKLYCNTKTFQFWFFNNKIDIQLIDDNVPIDLRQDINFDVKYGCYIRAVQSGFYVPMLTEFKFERACSDGVFGQTQFIDELHDFNLDSLLSKFKNGHELFKTDVIFKTGVMQILLNQNNSKDKKFDVYDLVDLYVEQYKILYDGMFKQQNLILPEIQNFNDNFVPEVQNFNDNFVPEVQNFMLTKNKKFPKTIIFQEDKENIHSKKLTLDMNYVVFDGTSHYVCDIQELENLKESKILFEICFESNNIDDCQSEADRLNDKV